MNSQAITPNRMPDGMLGRILESAMPNFAVLFAVGLVAFIWFELSPVWLPVLTWVASLLAPIFLSLCVLVLTVTGLLLGGFALAVVGLLLGGTIRSSH